MSTSRLGGGDWIVNIITFTFILTLDSSLDHPAMLPKPGSPSYLPSLLSHITSQPTLNGFQPDPVLFSAILLNLIVDRGGIIVDLPVDTDLKGKRRAVRHLTAISQGIFGRSTHLAELNQDVEPEELGYHLLHIGALPVSTPPHDDRPETNRRGDGDEVEEGLVVPQTLIFTGVEDVSSPTLLQLGDIILKKSVPAPTGSSTSSRLPCPRGFLYIWVRCSNKDSPGWWLDQFSSYISISPSDLKSVPNTSINPIIPFGYIANLRRLLDYTHIHPPLRVHISNLLSALSAHPSILPTLTGRAVRLFPLFVKTHRLLSSPFSLPPEWEEAVLRETTTTTPPANDIVYGKDIVKDLERANTWARQAGEEPTLSSLTGDLEDGYEGWYATPENVNGVWHLCMRHRVKLRRETGGGIMWMLQTSAADALDGWEREKQKGGDGAPRGYELDRILDKILQTI